jgi:hypothetical protein
MTALFAAILTESRRASAAAHRYEDLKRMAATARAGFGPADVPRRVFDEFYSLEAVGPATRSTGDRTLRPWPARA